MLVSHFMITYSFIFGKLKGSFTLLRVHGKGGASATILFFFRSRRPSVQKFWGRSPSRRAKRKDWGVGGEPQIKMIGNFLVLPRASLSSAAEAQVSFVKILRILSEI